MTGTLPRSALTPTPLPLRWERGLLAPGDGAKSQFLHLSDCGGRGGTASMPRNVAAVFTRIPYDTIAWTRVSLNESKCH